MVSCWGEFEGSAAEGMEAYKLKGRMEDVVWEPPLLSFRIERHGGTVVGSTRAELQRWAIDTEEASASCGIAGHRQLYPTSPRWDARPAAEEVVGLVVGRQDNELLKWRPDGSVRILVGKILPAGSAKKQTLEGRRKRLRVAVEELLGKEGWQKVGVHTFRRE